MSSHGHRSDKPLPWSLRHKLQAELRRVLVEYGRSQGLPNVLCGVIARFARSNRNAALRALAEQGIDGRSLLETMTSWVREMPLMRRSEWLVERLSEAAKLQWAPKSPVQTGPIQLPGAEREIIMRRLERVRSNSIARQDDEPEPAEYADAMDAELDRVGRKHEAFAVRVLTWRFADRSGAATLTFNQLLVQEALANPRAILRLLEEKLEIEWVEAPS